MSNIRRMMMAQGGVPINALLDIDGNPITTTLPDGTIINWRQILVNPKLTSANNWETNKNVSPSYVETDDELTTYCVQGSSASLLSQSVSMTDGHLYILLFDCVTNGDGIIAIGGINSTSRIDVFDGVNFGDYLATKNSSGNGKVRFVSWSGGAYTELKFKKNVSLYDLTEMFSECISYMPTSTDEFRRLFPNLGCVDKSESIKCIVRNGFLIMI